MMKEQSSLSYLYGTNVPYIEDLYEAYLSSPDGETVEVIDLPGTYSLTSYSPSIFIFHN